jgi:hypothetical protein
MASISTEPNGRKRVHFVGPDGKRQTIRLGKVSDRAAQAVLFRVEEILAAKLAGHAVPTSTAQWVADLGDVLRDKLARVGLIDQKQDQAGLGLGQFLDEYLAKRADVKGARWCSTGILSAIC